MATITQSDKESLASRAQVKWGWWVLIGLLAAIGMAVGFWLPTGELAGRPNSPRQPDSETSTNGSASSLEAPVAAMLREHSFALSPLDIKDTLEAPEIAVDGSGRIYLAWASQVSEGQRTLFVAISSDQGATFSEPRIIAKSAIFESVSQMRGKTVKRALRMVPHVAAAGERVVFAWLQSVQDNSTICLVLVESMDGGQTFSNPVCVHQSLSARPTFTGLSLRLDGAVASSWLDNRDKVQQPRAAWRTSAGEPFQEERLITAGQNDKGTCPCCPTSAVLAPDGTVYVAFRNIEEGHRDIAIGRQRPGQDGFDEPVSVVPPTWQFDGCPHDGASLALVGEKLHVSWMDARSGQQRVYYGLADTSDLKFQTQELNPSAPGTQGNSKLAVDSRGCLHAVWEENLSAEEPATEGESKHKHGAATGAGRVIMYSCAPHADGQFEKPIAVAPKPGKFQARPFIACGSEGEVYVTWNELDEMGKRVVAKRLDIRQEKP